MVASKLRKNTGSLAVQALPSRQLSFPEHPFFARKLVFMTAQDSSGRIRLGAFTQCICQESE